MTRLRSALCLAFLVAACGDDRTSVVATAPSPAIDVVLSGTVYEHGPFGRRPLASVPLDITELNPWVRSEPQFVSDAEGRYRFEIAGWQMPRGGYGVRVRAAAPGYRQPCRVRATLMADTTLDVHLVSDTTLSEYGIPPSLPISEPRLHGRVLDRTKGWDAPIAGASVAAGFGYDGSDRSLDDATTLTSAAGQYLICGVDSMLTLAVSAQGYRGARTEAGGQSSPYDIELTPR